MIVKVQVSLFSNHPSGVQQVLIYNQDRTVEWQGPITSLVGERLTEPKAFWHARLNGTLIELIKPASWRKW